MTNNNSLPPYKLSPRAAGAVAAVFGKEAVADGQIDEAELTRADLSADLMTAIGVESGSVIGAKESEVLRKHRLPFQPDAWQILSHANTRPSSAVSKNAIEYLHARAEQLAASGRGAQAFAAYCAVAKIARDSNRAESGAESLAQVANEAAHAAAQLLLNSESIPARARAQYAECRANLQAKGWDERQIDLATMVVAGRRGDYDSTLKNLAQIPALSPYVGFSPLEEIERLLRASAGTWPAGSELEAAACLFGRLRNQPQIDLQTAWKLADATLPWSGPRSQAKLTMAEAADFVVSWHATPTEAEDLLGACASTSDPRRFLSVATALRPCVKGELSSELRLLMTRLFRQPDTMVALTARTLLHAPDKNALAENLRLVLESTPRLTGEEAIALAETLCQRGLEGERRALCLELIERGKATFEQALAQVDALREVARTAGLGPEKLRSGALGTLAINALLKGTRASELAPALHFIGEYLFAEHNDPGYFPVWGMEALVQLDFDLTKATPALFPAALADAVSRALPKLDDTPPNPKLENAIGLCGNIINQVHDVESRTRNSDNLRKASIQALSPAGARMVAALCLPRPFPSTYLALRGRFAKAPSVGETAKLLRESDPGERFLLDYLLTLGRFMDQEQLMAGREALVPVLFDAILAPGREAATWRVPLGEEERLSWASRFLPYLAQSWPQLPEGERQAREAQLLAALDAPNDSPKSRAIAGLALRFLFEKNVPLHEAVANRAAALPPLTRPVPPRSQWLADHTVAVRMRFYPDEPSFGQTRDFFTSRGFVLNEAYRAKRGWRKDRDIVLERTIHGTLERVILSLNGKEDDPTQNLVDFSDPSIDIIAHRGHCYHFDKTFPSKEAPVASHEKLVIGGSCDSFADMTDDRFLSAYAGHQFIADADRGENYVTNPVVLRILDGVAKGTTSWDEMGLSGYAQSSGIILPNHPCMIGFQYGLQLSRQFESELAIEP